MSLSKFKNILFSFFLSFAAWGFDDNACLQSQFDVNISHKAPPLGLSRNVLELKKEGCVITLEHTKYFFVKRSWKIDVCREPVHIKQTGSSVNVLKRTHPCSEGDMTEYCTDYFQMREIIQDDGLIFAEGEKEDLNSDHGKVYCAYVLIDTHLQRGIVLSRDQFYEGFIVPLSGKLSPTLTKGEEKREEVAPSSESTPGNITRPLEPTKNDPSTGTF
ncbi:MAG: hypothetical protein Fur0010_18920 [Bdellovibrio sp.]